MNDDGRLVYSLIDRIAGRLPHVTRIDGAALQDDETLNLTRTTLVEVSKYATGAVSTRLVSILDGLPKRPGFFDSDTKYTEQSEIYVVELLADCFKAHWSCVRQSAPDRGRQSPFLDAPSSDQGLSTATATANLDAQLDALRLGHQIHRRRDHQPDHNASRGGSVHDIVPPSLADGQIVMFLNILTGIMTFVPHEYKLPTSMLLEVGPWAVPRSAANNPDPHSLGSPVSASRARADHAISEIIEYLSASNWSAVINYVQAKLRNLREVATPNTPVGPSSTTGPTGLSEAERNTLRGLQVIPHLWINGRKLGVLIQEICGYFLNLSKAAQNAIAILLPVTIARWLDKNPAEFVHLHLTEKRLNGSADVLFDMSNSMGDEVQRRVLLWPFQTALLLLIPDVFIVAGTLRHAKTGSIVKKATFLEGLRKGLRSPRTSDIAAFCLVGLCRAAHHFSVDSESALLSYTLDVLNEIREQTFDRALSTSATQDKSLDVHLLTATFISLCYLNFESVLENVAPKCFQSTTPIEFRLVVFSSCEIISKQPNANRYAPLFTAVAPHVRTFLKSLRNVQRSPTDDSISRQSPARDRPGTSLARRMLHAVLAFLAKHPQTILEETLMETTSYHEHLNEALENLVMFLADDDQRIRTLAAEITRSLISEESLIMLPRSTHSNYRNHAPDLWRSTSLFLSALSNKMIEHHLDEQGVKTLVKFVQHVLRTRLDLLKKRSDVQMGLNVGAGLPERNNASADLEVACLVLLCSSNLEICAAVTSSLGLFCEEGSLTENATDLAHSSLTIMRNIEVYSELSSPNIRLTGMVAFQKRLRKFLNKMTKPSTGILAAWEFIFLRWSQMNNEILTPSNEREEQFDEKYLMEWRNYSGFLAAIGGCCITDTLQSARLDESMIAGLRWIDRISPSGDDQSLLDRFLSQCLRLLFCDNLRVREATREVLGIELSAKLFPYLFQFLETELAAMFEGSSGASAPVLILEQAASLLKLMVEHLNDIREPLLNADFESMTLNLGRYANTLKSDISMLRVKIRICHLCESVTSRRDAMKVGHGMRVRNQLVSILLAWMSGPGRIQFDGLVSDGPLRTDEILRYQRDLNRACLRALVDLTYRLPLQTSADQSDAELLEAKTQLFFQYFNRLLSLLKEEAAHLDRRNESPFGSNRPEEASSALDLTISALSNLLSANIDVGLKHALEMGYHENVQVRTAFLRVLCNVLSQEAEFERLSDSAITEKYQLLIQIVIHDIGVVVALCDSCPSGDVDELAISLLNVYESRGMGFQLLKALIEHEVANTENESELLRRHSVTTKILSAYARWKGTAYLRSTLQEIIERLIQSSAELNLELDPTRSSSAEELHRNALQLQHVTQIFINAICSSGDEVPATFQRICHAIATAVTPRFPAAKFTAVGAFIFLRFFCPAIVAPDSEKLVTEVPTKEMRRGLLLIAKVIQNLANNVLFGSKEQYMSPLNDFLAQNISQVTAFLRNISSNPLDVEDEVVSESFDFGSSVVLHRFLYDHWDMVKQKILAQGRRSWQSSSVNAEPELRPTQQPTSLNQLANLIPSLGTPQIDVSWNNPHISANAPYAYSRFHEFMFKNARRNAETIMSSRAIYDGGKSKDDVPVICIVLRIVEKEEIDLDLLLFSFFKIASRLWHGQFGILIDVTSYRGLTTVPDEMVQRIESLSPAEVNKNLSRLYIYNMNSVYKKCFRRILRVVMKDSSSIFHPTAIEYHLLGTLQELQQHFHLGSLQLPKDTISVVTDSRFIYQPVLRLSRTKGRVEVIIKIGGQYVQVTTTKKQDIGPGLRLEATVNDVFRISDVDEAKTAIQIEDEKAFGIRTENGKIVMYFISPRKAEILQAIRTAKAKYTRDSKSTLSAERFVKPEDLPGALLNVSLMNLASNDRSLRLASYNMIAGLSRAFHFNIDKQLITSKELEIPANSAALVKSVSRKLSASEPRLTHDFLSEFFIGWERLAVKERPFGVLYMSPWLANMRKYILAADNDSDKGREKTAGIARKLLQTAIRTPSCSACFQEHVWPMIAKDDALVEVFLDEMVKLALETGPDMEQVAVIASIAAVMGNMTVRGKIIARLRKVLNRSSLRPTRNLIDNPVWDEVRILLRMCLESSFDSRAQSQMFLPELFHVITMLVHSGSYVVSACVHNLLINTVHSLCTTFPLPETRIGKLKTVLLGLTEPKVELLFDLRRFTSQDDSLKKGSHQADTALFSHLEAITNLLQSIIDLSAPSIGLANTWRCRWMSLVASTAFQSNPAIQPKAFTIMGCLASENVDDDLLYQVLVSLRTGVNRFIDEGDSELLIAIVTTLTKMVSKVSSTSRYVLHLFWLSISLVRLAPPAVYGSATSLLEAVLRALATPGAFKGGQMASVLLQGRDATEAVLSEVDDIFGVQLTAHNFHIGLSVSLMKGLTEPITRAATLRVLASLLEITAFSASENNRFPTDVTVLPYLVLLATRTTNLDERRELLWLAGLSSQIGVSSSPDVLSLVQIDHVEDNYLLLNAVLVITNFASFEDIVQQQTLQFLLRIMTQNPSVLVLLADPLTSLLRDVLVSSHTPATLEAGHALTRILTKQLRSGYGSKPPRSIEGILSSAGLKGIWKASSFDITTEQQGRCGALIDRLIELIII